MTQEREKGLLSEDMEYIQLSENILVVPKTYISAVSIADVPLQCCFCLLFSLLTNTHFNPKTSVNIIHPPVFSSSLHPSLN